MARSEVTNHIRNIHRLYCFFFVELSLLFPLPSFAPPKGSVQVRSREAGGGLRRHAGGGERGRGPGLGRQDVRTGRQGGNTHSGGLITWN